MKTKIFLFVVLNILCISVSFAQIGIGTKTPHESSIVEINSDNKGFLPPRLTQDQRNSITAPAIGLMIYNLDRNCLQIHNGSYWDDLCCSHVVNSGIDALPILIRVDPSKTSNFSKINTDGSNSGTTVVNNDFIHTISTSQPGVNLSYIPGSNETNNGNHQIFKYEEEVSNIPYKNKNIISRVQKSSGSTVSRLSYDFAPNRQSEFEIFLVGKMDNSIGNIVNHASFFSSSDNSSDQYSLQLGVGSGSSGCTKDFYRVLYTNGTNSRNFCTNAPNNVISSDDGLLHTFNLISKNHPTEPNKVVISLLIDGVFIDSDSTMNNHIIFEEFKMFSNRNSDNASKATIGELVFFNEPLNTDQREILNQFLLCKYGEE